MTTWHSRLVVQRSQLGRSVAISLVLRIVALMITAWTDSGRMIRIYTLASNKRWEDSLLGVSSQLVDIVIMIVLIHIRYLWQSNLITRIRVVFQLVKIVLASPDNIHSIICPMSSTCSIAAYTYKVWRLMVSSWLVVS